MAATVAAVARDVAALTAALTTPTDTNNNSNSGGGGSSGLLRVRTDSAGLVAIAAEVASLRDAVEAGSAAEDDLRGALAALAEMLARTAATVEQVRGTVEVEAARGARGREEVLAEVRAMGAHLGALTADQ